MNPTEYEARAVTLTAIWKLFERGTAIDKSVLDMLVNGTAAMSLEQIRAGANYLASHPPRQGTPLISALLDSADRATRDRQRLEDQGREPWCLPTIAIDMTRMDAQLRIVGRWRKPASSAKWDASELEALRAELEADSPRLAIGNAVVTWRLDSVAATGRMPSLEDEKALIRTLESA